MHTYMHLKLHTDSQKCSLYVNEIEHDHTNHIYNKEYNLPHKSKAKALELMSSSKYYIKFELNSI
jgi:hypothetical protein